jgi:signal transduction histidine kinase/DNA-binding response OmpR family regulator
MTDDLSSPALSGPARFLRGASVLVVDDSPLVRRRLTDLLRGAGARVEEAATGAEALRKAPALSPDVVVLDVELPDIRGFEVARHLKEHEATASIPVLHVSSERTTGEDRILGMEHGADGYLVHPVDPPVFLSTVGALVRMKQAMDRLLAHQAFTAAIVGAGTPEEVAARVLDEGLRATQADGAALVMGREDALKIVGTSPGWPAALGAAGAEASNETPGPLGVCVWMSEAAWFPSPGDFTAAYPHLANAVRGALVCIPLVFEGRAQGAVAFSFEESRRFTEVEKKLLTTLAGECALALERGQAREALRRSVRAREDLLAIVAHDLRNPLGAVVTGTSLIRAQIATDRPLDRAYLGRTIQRIQQSSERMQVLLDDLLDAARLESGQFTLDREPHRIEAIMGEVVELFEPLAREKTIALAGEVEDDLVAVCDRKRVVQILSNLVGNALKFTSAGGSIRIRALAGAGSVVLAVADTGAGIPEDHLPHLFDRYWTGQRRDGSGAGLGLFIVRGLVEAHGGRIRVESRVGEGTTFSFTLPAAALGIDRRGELPGKKRSSSGTSGTNAGPFAG